jgi:hypothetical protein
MDKNLPAAADIASADKGLLGPDDIDKEEELPLGDAEEDVGSITRRPRGRYGDAEAEQKVPSLHTARKGRSAVSVRRSEDISGWTRP